MIEKLMNIYSFFLQKMQKRFLNAKLLDRTKNVPLLKKKLFFENEEFF